MIRRHWPDLPTAVYRAVEQHTGRIEHVEPVATGAVSDLVEVLYTASGTYFCKGVHESNPLAWMHRNEARLNPHLTAVAARLRWHVEHDDWLLLGFDHVPGRHPDLEPAVVDGDTLAHTDVTPRNFLISGDRVVVVDWSMPCRGAAWIDTARMAIRLIRAGHHPAQAERWAATVPAWAGAPPSALDSFADAMATLTRQRQEQSGAPYLAELAAAAHRWATHRTRN